MRHLDVQKPRRHQQRAKLPQLIFRIQNVLEHMAENQQPCLHLGPTGLLGPPEAQVQPAFLADSYPTLVKIEPDAGVTRFGERGKCPTTTAAKIHDGPTWQ